MGEDFNSQWINARKAAGGNLLFYDSPLYGSAHADILRRGGGGGIPIAKPVGVMLLLLLGLSAMAFLGKQNQMVSAMMVGFIFGAARLDTGEPYLESEVNKTFIEFGMILTLFFSGLSVSISDISRYFWPQVAKMGVYQTLALAALQALIGWSSGLCESRFTVSFFGIAGVFASKSLLMTYQEVHNNEGTNMHIKIAKGLHLWQDFVLCCSMVVIHAFHRAANFPSDCALNINATNATINITGTRRASVAVGGCRRAGDAEQFDFSTPDGVTWRMNVLGDEIFRSLGIFLLAIMMFRWLSKGFLGKAFRFFVKDADLLFVGSMGWSLGACALAHQAGWSMTTAAYLAGLSLSVKPCRVQILNKIGSLRVFAQFIFYFMLGIYVHITPEFFTHMKHGHASNFCWSLVVALVVVVVAPMASWCGGAHVGLLSRTTLYNSFLVNSMGETSLILQVLAQNAGILNREVFLVLVVATWLTMIFSCVLQNVISNMYEVMAAPLTSMTRMINPKDTQMEKEREERMVMQGHVVLLGFNEVGLEVAEFFRARARDVICIDLDPQLHATFKSAYKGSKPKAASKIPAGMRLRGIHGTSMKFSPAQVAQSALELPPPAEVSPAAPPRGNSLRKTLDDAQGSSRQVMMQGMAPPTTTYGLDKVYDKSTHHDNNMLPPAPQLGVQAEIGFSTAAQDVSAFDVAVPPAGTLLWGEAFGAKDVDVDGGNDFDCVGVDAGIDACACAGMRRRCSETTAVSAANFGHAPQDIYSSASMSNPSPIMPNFATMGGSRVSFGGLQNHEPREDSEFKVDGRVYGCGTNIFSVYADPENSQSWKQYQLQKASLVVACMPDRLESSGDLCRYLSDTEVPVMIACTSNQDASELYDAGCTYVVQEDFLGGKEVAEMLWLEMNSLKTHAASLRAAVPVGPTHTEHLHVYGADHHVHIEDIIVGANEHADTSGLFALRAGDHKEELAEEESDLVRNRIGMFI